ncbi:hypothetical protein [Chondromyces apiculatus]|uniref:Uncharacterized protein n=1 Tax=Chondromyces apiculatus DSM 436 TaxID=1192034 RepID=A0A017SWM7_9BACT|nr:hypothetical protein [Chondromyces apiculatus]EYF00721.1 Hypothetical protein CAP_0289 [Chondromyces apiculatus DSM 436]
MSQMDEINRRHWEAACKAVGEARRALEEVTQTEADAFAARLRRIVALALEGLDPAMWTVKGNGAAECPEGRAEVRLFVRVDVRGLPIPEAEEAGQRAEGALLAAGLAPTAVKRIGGSLLVVGEALPMTPELAALHEAVSEAREWRRSEQRFAPDPPTRRRST